MAKHLKSADALHAEIAEIDRELAQTTETHAKAQSIMNDLALPARRGDAKAAKKLAEYEDALAEEQTLQRRRQAARASLESELQTALALERNEETKAKAREARKIVARLRSRGADVDATIRKLLDEYNSIASDVAALINLGASQINLRLVQLGCERALRAKLMSIKELELRPVAPLERREFASLVDAWTAGAERWINLILKAEEPTTPAGADRSVAEQAQAGA